MTNYFTDIFKNRLDISLTDPKITVRSKQRPSTEAGMNIHTPLPVDTTHPADMLGILKARIAEYEALADIERDKLVALGDGDHDGLLFHAKVSIAERKTVKWQAICKHFDVPDEMIKDNTTSKVVITVTCNSR